VRVDPNVTPTLTLTRQLRVTTNVLAKMAGVENADSLGAVAELYDPTCSLDLQQPFPVRPDCISTPSWFQA